MDNQKLTLSRLPINNLLHDTVLDFYDRALIALAAGFATIDDPVASAEYHARCLTERRFGVKLVLPGDGD